MLKVIDVSTYQGTIDWKKVRADGVSSAIIKVIRKDLNPDKQFENNWKGCEKAGMPIHGVYNYSYATTVSKAKTDAKRVLEVLNGRKARVYLDVEDQCQKGLGKLLIDIINAYSDVITGAGYEFGVYTGLSFYNSYIKPFGGLNCPLWIARYGKNDGKLNETYKPNIKGMIGWQYTSKATVKGVNGKCDMSVWYEELDETEYKPPLKTIDEIAKEVIAGIHGNGKEREKNILAKGYDYVAVQALVNQMLHTGYYNRYTGTSTKIDVVFGKIGVPDIYVGNKMKRKPIALANGITNYTGTGSQNLSLIALAKKGKLKKV
jgi:GH25 family lysozyme M1 (1,4-beta-N-acetylmuramidase)